MPRPVSNPPNPWSTTEVEWLGEPPPATLEIFEEEAASILSENDSPDLGFRWSVNPYRGCYHGCAYCYARPTHQYLGWGAGTDFDRKIIVKTNAAALLRQALERRSWKGEPIVFSGVTDCYQPLEASYRVTRGCLEVCREFHQPVSVITKGALVARDLDLLAELARVARARVSISVAFADDETSRLVEPWASRPSQRFAALAALSAAGVSTGVAIAPIIPGLNDSDIPALLERAHAAGARRAFVTLVRLPREVLPVFEERIDAAFSGERVRRIRHAIVEMRAGKSNESAFGARMRGVGARWDAIEALFQSHCRRLGFNVTPDEEAPPATTFRRVERQGSLF